MERLAQRRSLPRQTTELRRHRSGMMARSHQIVANWEMLDEQERFELFAEALLRWCGKDEEAARTLWVELESLRSRTGAMPNPWPRRGQPV